MKKNKTIRQEVFFKALPEEVYEALMNSKKHATFTEAKAAISTKIGGKFTAYDGYITGKNLALKPGKQIVQSWRGSDWPEDALSVAKFTLKKSKGGTLLLFVQTDVPADFYSDINQGWKDYYWKPLKKTFGW